MDASFAFAAIFGATKDEDAKSASFSRLTHATREKNTVSSSRTATLDRFVANFSLFVAFLQGQGI